MTESPVPSLSQRRQLLTALKVFIIVLIAAVDVRNLKIAGTVLRHDGGQPIDTSILGINELPERRNDYNLTSCFSSNAYAFVIGGCDPTNRASYQNYLFNIAVAARILKQLGSQSDVVAMFQMSQKATELQLPKEDLELLHSQNVSVYYIPQQITGRESFYRTQLDKFRILGLTQYEKVLFMDGDIMPLCNLDFFFDHEQFQENVVMQGLYEPFNGGFFMLKTGQLRLQEVQKIIENHEQEVLTLPKPYFDYTMGWGHDLSDDPWVSSFESGRNWSFVGAHADQGLLYYYAKYHRKSFSVLNRRGGGVKHYGWNGTGVQQLGPIDRSLDNHSSVIEPLAMKLKGKHRRHPFPQRCILHFTGINKPWMNGGAPTDCCTNETQYKSGKHHWSYQLHELLQELNRDIDLKTYWDPSIGNHRPALGFFSTPAQVLHSQTNILTLIERVYG